MKTNLTTSFIICLLFLVCVIETEAQRVITLPDSTCMSANGTISTSCTQPVKHWEAYGDLSIVGSNTGSSATFQSTGYGKGVIRVAYENGGCNAIDEVDVFKEFTPDSTLQIEGLSCVSPGDVVVFSIEPILTKNLEDRIGIDNYYWNVQDSIKPDFVDTLYYTAGDGSSVTFKVKDWNNTTPQELTVNLGYCNQSPSKAVRLVLNKQAPKPVLDAEQLCIPYGTDAFTVSVQNPSSDVAYSWEKPLGWELSYLNSDSTSVSVTPDKSSIGEIVVSAMYKSGEYADCAITKTTLPVYRRWGDNVGISAQTTCAVAENSSFYRFTLTGDMPTQTPVRWEFPNTWEIQRATNDSYIYARPMFNANLTDTVKVYEMSECNVNDLKSASLVVHVKPAKMEISGQRCVVADSAYTYTATRLSNSYGPNAKSYQWRVNGTVVSGQTDSIASITIPAGANKITVTPVGEGGCNGNISADYKIMVNPTDPDSIVWVDEHCLSAGMYDTITLRIAGSIATQTYSWDFSKTRNWLQIGTNSTNNSEIIVRTSGIAGNDTIEAFTNGDSICYDTRRVSIMLTTESVNYIIGVDNGRRYYSLFSIPEDLTTLSEFSNETLYYKWLVNGLAVDSGYNSYEYSIEKALVPSNSIISLRVNTNSGCIYQASSSLEDALQAADDYYDSQSQQGERKIREKVNDKDIIISPNPAQSVINVKIVTEDIDAIICIQDLNGRVIMKMRTNDIDTKLPINKLQNGVYNVIIKQGRDVISKKLIVNR